MITAEQKDALLREIQETEIMGIDDTGDPTDLTIANILLADGNIQRVSEFKGGMAVRITPRGISFLANGGYTAEAQREKEAKERAALIAQRQGQLTDLQIQQLLDLPEEQRRTRNLAKVAIVVSIAMAVFEIVKALRPHAPN